MAKAKWLEESLNQELLDVIAVALDTGEDKEFKRAVKAVEELKERLPEGLTLADAIAAVKTACDMVETAYQAELDGEDTPEDEKEDDNGLSNLSKKELMAKAVEEGILKRKEAKVMSKEELIEALGGSDEKDDEGGDYDDWNLKALKKECRERGIKVSKNASKEDLIEALEEDDEED